MEFKIAVGFTSLMVLMLAFGTYSVGSYQSNQPNFQEKELLMLDSINRKLEISNQEIRARIARGDSILKDLKIQNAKLRKALKITER